MFGWSIFDSHHIIKISFYSSLSTEKNFYVEIFLYGFLSITMLLNGMTYWQASGAA